MKKIIYSLATLFIVGLAKLGYDVYVLSAQQNAWTEKYNQVVQNDMVVNDQIAGIQRQVQQFSEQSPQAKAESLPAKSPLDVMHVIRMQLDFIEFALQQHQPLVALEKIDQLQQQSFQAELSDALQSSLQKVLEQDRQLIMNYMQAIARQQVQMGQVLEGIDRELNQQIAHPQPEVQQGESGFFSRWFHIEAATELAPIQQRTLVLKEVQLRGILAQQELLKGRQSAYKLTLTEMISLLKPLPDAKSVALRKKLESLKEQAATAIPHLNTRVLIG